MKGLWCVIGKACCDDEFALDLKEVKDNGLRIREKASDQGLSEFLALQHGYMLSRWERAELRRLFDNYEQLFTDTRKQMEAPPKNASENFYAALGLSFIDSVLIKFFEANVGDKLALARKFAEFRLSSEEIRWFSHHFQKADVFALHWRLQSNFWTKPKSGQQVCAWNFSTDAKYVHTPPGDFHGANPEVVQQQNSSNPFVPEN